MFIFRPVSGGHGTCIRVCFFFSLLVAYGRAEPALWTGRRVCVCVFFFCSLTARTYMSIVLTRGVCVTHVCSFDDVVPCFVLLRTYIFVWL